MDIITDFMNVLANYTSIYFIVLVLISAFAAKLADWILYGIIIRFVKQTETTFDDKLINALHKPILVLEASFSERFYGDSYGLNFTHRNKRLTNTVSYVEDIQTLKNKKKPCKINFVRYSYIERGHLTRQPGSRKSK